MADNYISLLDVDDVQNIKIKDTEASSAIGQLSNLKTTNKTNLVSAINEAINIDKIYKNINEMVAANIATNEVALVVTPQPSYWLIESSGTASLICKKLNNGYFAKLLNKGSINLGSLGNYNNMDDISGDVQYLLDNGYNDIIIPEGTYVCSVNISGNQSISGSHISRTILIPKNHTQVFNINGDYIKISNLWISDVSPYSARGISIGSNAQCDNSHFENVHLENLDNGFLSTGEMIWNEFFNCDFIGCFNCGFTITSSTAFFNDNAFYSCKFNNNVNAGIVIDVSEQHDYANTFYSCNIEYNAQDRFGQTHTSKYAVLNTGFTSFIGCYFEGNGADNNHSTIQNWDMLNIVGCSLIWEKNVVDNNHPNAITNFICNKQYDCNAFVTTNITPVNAFGNNFTLN